MGNTYPGSISSYPGWVAHVTPYTAEWSNSVGFEFYSIEYELGTNPKGSFVNVKERIEAIEENIGFNYFTWAYLRYQQLKADNNNWQKVDLDDVKIDEGAMWDVGNKRILINKAGWYEVIGNLSYEPKSNTAATDQYFQLRKNTETVTYVRRIHFEIDDTDYQGFQGLGVSVVIYCEVGDYFALWHKHEPSQQVHFRSDYDGTFLSVRMVRRPV